jgi:hypothetical protein
VQSSIWLCSSRAVALKLCGVFVWLQVVSDGGWSGGKKESRILKAQAVVQEFPETVGIVKMQPLALGCILAIIDHGLSPVNTAATGSIQLNSRPFKKGKYLCHYVLRYLILQER